MKILQRILALLGAVLLLSLVGMTLFFAFTGSPYFLASMFAMIVVPVFIYGYMLVYRAMAGKKDDLMEQEEGSPEKRQEK